MTTYNTGNPIGSTDSRDRLDNTENMDYLENSTTELTHPDRLGTVRKTRHGMEAEHDAQIAAHEVEHDNQIAAHEVEHDNQMQAFESDFDGRLAGMAFTRVGSFTTGATLTDMRQVLIWEVSQGGDGHEYGWAGAFPKVVAAGATPVTSGGIGAGAWVDRTDVTLRSELNVVVKVFASVADMITDASLVVGQKCKTLGYYAIGDGGANDYEVVAAATGTDDGGSYIDLSGSGYQAKGLFIDGVVSVKQFGAVGDGVTDDTVKIQNSINVFDNVLIDGKFLTSDTISIDRPGVSFYGKSISTDIGTNNVDENASQIIFNGLTYAIDVSPDIVSDIERISIKNLAITGNGTNSGIFADKLRHSLFDNVYITNVQDCFYFNETCWQNSINRCQGMNYTRYGIFANSGTEDSKYENCSFRGYYSTSVGLYINYHSATNTVINCDFSDNKTNVVINPSLSTTDGVYTFTGCQFEGGTGGGSNNHIGVYATSSAEGSIITLNGCRWTHTDPTYRAVAKAIKIDAAKALVVNGARVTNIGTFIDIPTASLVGRLDVSNVTGGSVTTTYANQAILVVSIKSINVLASPDINSENTTGTFTPVVFGTTSDGVGTYTKQLGAWTKIGNIVFFSCEIAWTAHTGTGSIQLRFLPFTSSASLSQSSFSVYCSGIPVDSPNTVQGFVFTSTKDIRFRQIPPSGVPHLIPIPASGSLIFSGMYFI